MRQRPPAMTDVAALAGVSHQTVSRVLNAHPNVSEDTRARVRAAIAELGYRPNRAAKALVTGRSHLIGVVTQTTTLYGPASLLVAFENAAALAGMNVTLASVPTMTRQALVTAVNRQLDQGVAGIVVIAPVASAQPAIDGIPDDVPYVVVDGDPDLRTDLVTIDQVEGARLATRHLLDAGHATVWHVSGPPGWFDSAGRLEGWRSTLQAAGCEVPPAIPADWTAAAGFRAGRTLARMSEVTAVFAANDHLALGLLRAFHEDGRSVPVDISVVGFDDVAEAAYFTPPLTSVRPDFLQAANRTLGLLLERMATPDRPAERAVIAPELVVRASVGPPRSRR
ncbi:LacI family DNA-binding transcriptional regulator [Jatrophihabitans telluris]|uniref:LacI family DNA-binding transcriptional regulator n=1 Tax=Jatrophihabitans telluris TaxID=2038343 RepID=A0ABY4QY74_9ACTN|nr:LacI family DNA-binding transcriptional regulator [Jatrophihabitans telluris]UQX88450.1 LacI family DNA-binding transcriptional regulator [Jatrophihabitans telluris]